MPPRTRTRTTKNSKENVDVGKKIKVKSNGKITKHPRKALADKTNSLSDDNASIEVPNKTSKVTSQNKAANTIFKDDVRPRRERRLPTRYVENQALNNLSNSRDTPVKKQVSHISVISTSFSKLSEDDKVKQSATKNFKILETANRPKRNCRLQSSLGKGQENYESSKEPPATKKPETPSKQNNGTSSPFKTTSQDLDNSLITNRPKRICRLPSKFEDHLISPNKVIPVQPCHASTPIVQKNKTQINVKSNGNLKPNLAKRPTRKIKEKTQKESSNIGIEYYFSKSQINKKTNTPNKSSTPKDKTSPDTNNNPKGKRTLAKRIVSTKSQAKQFSSKANTNTSFEKRLLCKSTSFRVFEDRKSKDKDEDVYEFTFDPNEEPPPQKKKRKRVVKKRSPKPKNVFMQNNYDKNLQKALECLKNKVKPSISQNTQPTLQSQKTQPNLQSKSTQTALQSVGTQPAPQGKGTQPNLQSEGTQPALQSKGTQPALQNKGTQPALQSRGTQPALQSKGTQPALQSINIQPQNIPPSKPPAEKITIIEDIIIKPAAETKSLNNTPAPVNESAKSIHMSNYASIHVEDIAADFESLEDNINYSPVNSPCQPETPEVQTQHIQKADDSHITVNKKDPLNLQGDNSFFDEQPVASSSMNVSVRHPLDSPWRAEFGSLPIKWQANTYVKANMTPAVESSFINSEEFSKKKHVYTNMVTEEPLPQIEDPPNLKQTSIISFMKEVAERSLKKKRGRSMSPVKANSLFEDLSTSNFGFQTPKKARKDKVVSTPNVSSSSNDKSCDKEILNQDENHENSTENEETSNENSNPEENLDQTVKSPTKKRKKKDKDGTFFGFDESESCDQENKSPIKNMRHTRARGLKKKSRTVLQEINAMTGPTRATLPVTTKSILPSSDAVEKLYDQMKSAEEAPQLPENGKSADESVTNEPLCDDDDDSQSVHLFEDIEVVHHLKPQRKSYGKAKKVTFRQRSNSDSDTQVPEVRSSDEDDLGDLTFQMPNVKEKVIKKKKKKQLSKKEVKEVEEWAAGFNSMCEDIDEFPLVVE